MSQADFGTINAATKSGSQLATDLNAWRSALHSLHKGNERPAYAVAGMLWVKDATTPWGLYLYDGADDILIGTVNATSNVFTPSFGSLSGLVLADGSGGVSAATAAQIVAVISTLAVANATHADSANSATSAGSASTATAIGDGAVSTAAKISANIITLAKLARTGTAGKPLLSGGASADFYVGDFPNVPSLGVGQTWQNMAGSRSAGVTYTNSTGNPIVVAATFNNGGSPFNTSFSVNGVVVISEYYYTGVGGTGPIIVPNGATYSSSGAALSSWFELR